MDDAAPAPQAPQDHAWTGGRCSLCGLQRRETWVLDDQDRAVQALIWSDAQGRPVRAIAFPWMRGTEPVLRPRRTLADAFPRLPLGREPSCAPDRFRA